MPVFESYLADDKATPDKDYVYLQWLREGLMAIQERRKGAGRFDCALCLQQVHWWSSQYDYYDGRL